MSEQATPPIILDNGNAEAQGGTGDGDGQAQDNWYDGLGASEDNQAYIAKQGYKDIDNVIKSSREAQKMLSDGTRVPDFTTATDEVTANFWTKAGKPEAADKYDLSMPEGLDEGFQYDGDFANSYKDMAHAANLTQAQGDALHGEFLKRTNQMQIDQRQAQQEQFVTQTNNANKILSESWGETGSEAFKAEQDNAFKAIKAGGDGLMTELKASGVLGAGGEVLQPEVIKAFAMMGKRIHSEGGQLNGVNTIVGNPFSEKTFNLSAQMSLYKNDRSRYDSLKAAAVN